MSDNRNSAVVAVPREDVDGDDRWSSVHLRYVAQAKQKEPEIIFLGDSIIQRMEVTQFWRESFEQLHALTFGIGGDQTQHLLWRIQDGELDFCKPKMVIIHVGTNNIDHSPTQIVEGIKVIAQMVHQKQPQAIVVVTILLPRGQYPNPLRARNFEVNELLEQCNFGFEVQLEDIDAGFVNSDGTISYVDMYDYLHLTEVGYEKAFGKLYEFAKNYVGGPPTLCIGDTEAIPDWFEEETASVCVGEDDDEGNQLEILNQ